VGASESRGNGKTAAKLEKIICKIGDTKVGSWTKKEKTIATAQWERGSVDKYPK